MVTSPLNTDLSGTLLWTNSSPTSSFATQTVSVDLTGYSRIVVSFCANQNGIGTTTVIYEQLYIADVKGTARKIGGYGTNVQTWVREFSVVSTGLNFGNCTAWVTDGTSQTTVNTSLIPYQIRAFKY